MQILELRILPQVPLMYVRENFPLAAKVTAKNNSPKRVPIGLQIGWALIVIFGALMVPESPRFLVIRGRIDDARASLARLRSASADSEEVNTELEEIQGNYEYELSLGDTSYVECFRGKMCAYLT